METQKLAKIFTEEILIFKGKKTLFTVDFFSLQIINEICPYLVPRGTKICRGGTNFLWGGTKRGGSKFFGGDLFFRAWGEH